MKKLALWVTGFLLAAFSLWGAGLQAQEVSRVGTAAGQFLKIGMGARAVALAGAFVSITDDVSTLFWNPAGIATIPDKSLQLSEIDLYLGLRYRSLAFAYPLGPAGALGFSAAYFSSGDIEITTVEQWRGTGQYYQVQNLFAGLSYARPLTDRVQMGVTLKYVQEKIYREVARALAADAGVLVRTGLLGMNLGICVANIGQSLQLQGPDLHVEFPPLPEIVERGGGEYQYRTRKWPLPLTFRLGVATYLVGSKGILLQSEAHSLLATFQMDDATDAPIYLNGGLEFQWRPYFTARFGYHGRHDTARWVLGGGFQYPLSWFILRFDYAYAAYQDLGHVDHFTIGVIFLR